MLILWPAPAITMRPCALKAMFVRSSSSSAERTGGGTVFCRPGGPVLPERIVLKAPSKSLLPSGPVGTHVLHFLVEGLCLHRTFACGPLGGPGAEPQATVSAKAAHTSHRTQRYRTKTCQSPAADPFSTESMQPPAGSMANQATTLAARTIMTLPDCSKSLRASRTRSPDPQEQVMPASTTEIAQTGSYLHQACLLACEHTLLEQVFSAPLASGLLQAPSWSDACG